MIRVGIEKPLDDEPDHHFSRGDIFDLDFDGTNVGFLINQGSRLEILQSLGELCFGCRLPSDLGIVFHESKVAPNDNKVLAFKRVVSFHSLVEVML